MRGPDCAMRGELLEWALDSAISNNLNFADSELRRAAVVARGAAIRLTQDNIRNSISVIKSASITSSVSVTHQR